MPWFTVGSDACSGPLWEDTIAFRLLMLLRSDAVVADCGTIRFSYPVYARRLAYRDPANWSRRVEPSRDGVRGALERLADMKIVAIPPPVGGPNPEATRTSRRQQGGQQGWFAVTVVGYTRYRGSETDRPSGRAKTGPDPEAKPPTPRVEDRTGERSVAKATDADKPRKRKKPEETDPRINSLKVAWLSLYRTATGEEPPIFGHGQWGGGCQTLLKKHDEAAILERAGRFFADPKSKRMGYAFGAFFKDFALWNGQANNGQVDQIAIPETGWAPE